MWSREVENIRKRREKRRKTNGRQLSSKKKERRGRDDGRKGQKEGGRGGHAPVSQAGSDVPVQRVVSDVGLSTVEETDMDRSRRPIEVIGD